MTAKIQKSLRETAKLFSTHYSTMIEGNRLTLQEADQVITKSAHFTGRERDEMEVVGYYSALDEVDKLTEKKSTITESIIKNLHGHIITGNKHTIKPTPYRDIQNVIKDSATGAIVYLPPEAADVPGLMKQLVNWLNNKTNTNIPSPIVAGITHYQFATIHPYMDGNGRTARILATLIMRLKGYDLHGFYSLEEYYARDLMKYYNALSIGESHNYYMGRAEADITGWIEYFCKGVVASFENVLKYSEEEQKKGSPDQNLILRELDSRQRKVLDLFFNNKYVNSPKIAEHLNLSPRSSRRLVTKWCDEGFFIAEGGTTKTRKYRLAEKYEQLVLQ